MRRADVLRHRGVAGVDASLPSPACGRRWPRRRPDEGLRRPLREPSRPLIWRFGRHLPAQGEREQGLQRTVPVRQVDIDLAHFDAVLARVAHELRRRVEAERLGVEHRRGEHVRIAALHPAGGVDEQREARRMALGKAVFAKTLDLAEAALGEVALVALGRHALDHLVLKGLDRADPAEGRHGAAQLVGFGRGEARGDDGDPHRLLLEQRHAERLAAAPPRAPSRDRRRPRAPAGGADRDAPCRPGSGRGARSRPRSRDRRSLAGFSRGSIDICARLSIWNTPIVSARWIIA